MVLRLLLLQFKIVNKEEHEPSSANSLKCTEKHISGTANK
jgi:hypothetical protein